MPDERMDVSTPIKGSDGRTFWRKVGAAFPNRNGPGYNVKLELMPLPAEGAITLIIRPPDENRQAGRQSPPPGQGGPARPSYAPRPPSASQGGNAPTPIDPNDELPPW